MLDESRPRGRVPVRPPKTVAVMEYDGSSPSAPSNSRYCRKCGDRIPSRSMVDGCVKNTGSRKYCLRCSPPGMHNTKRLEGDHVPVYRCKCGQADESRFYVSAGHRTICKDCFNRDSSIRQNKTKARASRYLGGRCMACGFDRWLSSLEFHHLDPTKKDPTFTSIKSWSWRRVLREMWHCILLCSNCHRAHHAGNDIFEGRS